MTPHLRKFTLTAHVVFSVGWLGAVAAYLALAVAALTQQETSIVRASFISMEMIGWFVVVPLSLASLVTGLVQSLGTEWGLVRHYWILAKLFLTVAGITILLLHTPAVSRMAGLVAADTAVFAFDLPGLRHPTFVVHAAGGLTILLAATILSVFKPWGLTPFGRRRRHQQGTVPMMRPSFQLRIGALWKVMVILAIAGLLLLLGILHFTGAGPHGH
jgi:hypothetical protein